MLSLFYIYALIAMSILIPKENLIDGGYYLGESNYASVGRWNAKLGLFEYIYNSAVNTVPYINDVNLEQSGIDFFVPIQQIFISQANRKAIKTGNLQIVPNELSGV